MKDIVVIGSGPSGIIAALKASKKNNVILLEKNDKIGKKILVTGNGKCNLWNTNLFKEKLEIEKYYYTDDFTKLKKILEKKDQTYSYLTNELGIFTKEKNTYIYPYSNTATSIRETLERKLLNNKNIEVILNFEAVKIEKKDNKFLVYNKNNEYYKCDKVVISVGSKSSNLGTDSLDNLLGLTNIKINEEFPSLVPIKLEEKYLKDWNGIRCDVKLSLLVNNKKIKEEEGEIQLTDYGISGIVSFNLSGYINRIKDEKYLEIDFMPDFKSDNELLNIFKLINSSKTIEEVLETLFNYKLLFIILKKSNIKKEKIWNDLKEEELKNLINTIKHFKVKVKETLSFDRSQVTTGGISLKEIDDNLMLNKLKDIYVTGEILDVDGICGGYNLAFAFITGFIVGELC